MITKPRFPRLLALTTSLMVGAWMPLAQAAAADIDIEPGIEVQTERTSGQSMRPSTTRQQGAPIRITLSVGQAHVLREGPVKRIAVGNGKVLQVTPLESRELLLMAEAAGQSTLHLWGANGERKRYVVTVTDMDPEQLLSEVRSLLGDGSRVTARTAGGRVVIEGQHPREEDVFRIGEIVQRYPQVVNLIARTGFEPMVFMEVRMIEIARSAIERLGVQWQSARGGAFTVEGPSFGVIGDVARASAFQAGGAAAAEGLLVRSAVAPIGWMASLASSMSSLVDVLVSRGEAIVLAEPRLSSRSGGTARFVAGGELPIPVTSGNGSTNVQFKEYGVRFEVSPVVNEAGVISAALHTEVSSINPEVLVKDVPGLRKQSAETQVNLRAGETLVIAGMVSNDLSVNVDQIPGLGSVPVLGKLFRSRRFQERQTELIILITPRVEAAGRALEQERVQRVEQNVEQARQRIRMMD